MSDHGWNRWRLWAGAVLLHQGALSGAQRSCLAPSQSFTWSCSRVCNRRSNSAASSLPSLDFARRTNSALALRQIEKASLGLLTQLCASQISCRLWNSNFVAQSPAGLRNSQWLLLSAHLHCIWHGSCFHAGPSCRFQRSTPGGCIRGIPQIPGPKVPRTNPRALELLGPARRELHAPRPRSHLETRPGPKRRERRKAIRV